MGEKKLRLSEEEIKNTQRAQALLSDAKEKGSPAVEQIRALLQEYGLITDREIKDLDRAESARHRTYNYYKSIDQLLKGYRKYRRTLKVYRHELESLVKEEDVGDSVRETNDFFTRLCESLELISVYDERKMRRRYEGTIRSCQYIEDALQSLEFGLRRLEAFNPKMAVLLRYVYIDGERRPTIQECIEKMNVTGSSTYYRQMEAAKKKLSELVFGAGSYISKDQLFNILVFLEDSGDDGASL